ncbi:hypothetical protein POUND7_007317 [Theobroma cacao]
MLLLYSETAHRNGMVKTQRDSRPRRSIKSHGHHPILAAHVALGLPQQPHDLRRRNPTLSSGAISLRNLRCLLAWHSHLASFWVFWVPPRCFLLRYFETLIFVRAQQLQKSKWLKKKLKGLLRRGKEEGDPGVVIFEVSTVESLRKRALKKLESLRKLVTTAYSVERNKTQTPRYLLRSMSKENKKPPIAVNNQSSVISTGRKPRARRVKRV